MTKIVLKGNPLSTQSIYKYACRGKFSVMYMTKKGKDIKERYQWEMKNQWDKPLLKAPIELFIILYFGDKRKRDIDNFNKLILDAGEEIIWKNDKDIKKLIIEKRYDKEYPRIELFATNMMGDVV